MDYKEKHKDTDDTLVREFVIKLYKEFFNINLEPTPPKKNLIDLIGVDDSNFRVEVEHGQWSGDFWNSLKYCNKSNLEFPTVNIPIRKEKHWKESYTHYRKMVDNSNSYKINEFVRTNIDFTQFILIKPDTIIDTTKKIYTEFFSNYGKENWMSFKREDVLTYNLINGEWVLEEIFEITNVN
jgi:hypothetical protein